MILKLVLDQGWNCVDWIQLTMERDQFHKKYWISRLTKALLLVKEGLGSMLIVLIFDKQVITAVKLRLMQIQHKQTFQVENLQVYIYLQ